VCVCVASLSLKYYKITAEYVIKNVWVNDATCFGGPPISGVKRVQIRLSERITRTNVKVKKKGNRGFKV
jgi:hypothetical protein